MNIMVEKSIDRSLFRVDRIRKNEKQGLAVIFFKGVEIATFDEQYIFQGTWDKLTPHTSVINGYASDINDEAYINVLMESKLSKRVLEIASIS